MGGDQPMARRVAAAQQQADHGDRAGPRLGRRLGGAPGGFRVPAPGGKGEGWRGWGGGQKGRGSCLVSATAVLGEGGERHSPWRCPEARANPAAMAGLGRPGFGGIRLNPPGPWRAAACGSFDDDRAPSSTGSAPWTSNQDVRSQSTGKGWSAHGAAEPAVSHDEWVDNG